MQNDVTCICLLLKEKAHRLEEEEKATREMERLQKEIEDLKTQRVGTRHALYLEK